LLLSPQFEGEFKKAEDVREEFDSVDLENSGEENLCTQNEEYQNVVFIDQKCVTNPKVRKENLITFANSVSIPKLNDFVKRASESIDEGCEQTHSYTKQIPEALIDLTRSTSIKESNVSKIEKNLTEKTQFINVKDIETLKNDTNQDSQVFENSIQTSVTNIMSPRYLYLNKSSFENKIYSMPVDLPVFDSRVNYIGAEKMYGGQSVLALGLNSHRESEILVESFAKQIDDFLSKPITNDEDDDNFGSFYQSNGLLQEKFKIIPMARPNFTSTFKNYVIYNLDIKDRSPEDIFDCIMCNSSLSRISKAFFNLRMEV
jgi:hypothetical protein